MKFAEYRITIRVPSSWPETQLEELSNDLRDLDTRLVEATFQAMSDVDTTDFEVEVA